VFQAFLEAFMNLVFEVVLRSPGYLVLRCFYPSSRVYFDEDKVALTGLLLWSLVGITVALFIIIPSA
jgi:hypothetical protein